MRTRRWLGAAAVLFLIGSTVDAQTPELRILGGFGMAGGTTAVTIELAGDTTGSAVTADLDLRFPITLVEIHPPISSTCQIAERLAETHQVGGRPLEPGLISIAIFARNLIVAPLGDGALASCGVHVLPGVGSGTAAALTPDFAGLGDSDGAELPVIGVGGEIVIGELAPCVGDCSGNRVVTVDEIIRGVRIVLGELPLSNCPAFDSGSGTVGIADLIAAVNNVLFGCPQA
jgi:hypothetical protein